MVKRSHFYDLPVAFLNITPKPDVTSFTFGTVIPVIIPKKKITRYNTFQPFEETRQKLHKPSCFNFSSGFDVLFFNFSHA